MSTLHGMQLASHSSLPDQFLCFFVHSIILLMFFYFSFWCRVQLPNLLPPSRRKRGKRNLLKVTLKKASSTRYALTFYLHHLLTLESCSMSFQQLVGKLAYSKVSY